MFDRVERMIRAFPWMLSLSLDDREACVRDLREAFTSEDPSLLAAEFTAWKETATAIAEGIDCKELEWLDPSDDACVVTRPA